MKIIEKNGYRFSIGQNGKLLCSLRDYSIRTSGDTLSNRVALITGGGSGIGLEIAKCFLEEGARVIVVGRNKNRLENACRGMDSNRLAYIPWDIADIDRTDELINLATRIFGSLDLLVNSAGLVSAKGIQPVSFISASVEDFDSCFSVNAMGCYFLCRSFINSLIKRSKSGNILNIISNTGFRPATTPYHVTKWMEVSFTYKLADEFAGSGIYINGIAPGAVMTDMSWHEGESVTKQDSPNGRMAHPKEIAELAVHMVGSESRMLHGEIVVMDGGQLLK